MLLYVDAAISLEAPREILQQKHNFSEINIYGCESLPANLLKLMLMRKLEGGEVVLQVLQENW